MIHLRNPQVRKASNPLGNFPSQRGERKRGGDGNLWAGQPVDLDTLFHTYGQNQNLPIFNVNAGRKGHLRFGSLSGGDLTPPVYENPRN
jgi:hypothetical protein